MQRYIQKRFLIDILALGSMLIALSSLLIDAPASAQNSANPPSFWPKKLPDSRKEIELSYAPLVQQVSPAVVNVYTRKTVRRSEMLVDMFGLPFARGPGTTEKVQNSLGSGVIVGADGIIVTNNHVIEGADEFLVVLSDRREYPAKLVLADERSDLAVLRINTGGVPLPTLPFADTRQVEVGDLVLAIGNPFGVGQTVTSGIISATARTDVGVSDYAFFLQTDAAVNPGNSGGALVNTRGQLVGINTAIYSSSGGSNGIGFVIPAEMVKRVVDSAVNEGRIIRPWLGLKGQSVTFDMARAQGLDRPLGVLVSEVYTGGPVDKAGLKRGDIVLRIDGREVFDERGLKFLAATRSPNDTVSLSILRAGKEQALKVRLAQPPGATAADLTVLTGRQPFSGAEVTELSPRLAEELGLDPFSTGILVTRIQRGAYAWNIVRPGDIILSVDGKSVKSVVALKKALSRLPGDWELELSRNGRKISGTVTL